MTGGGAAGRGAGGACATAGGKVCIIGARPIIGGGGQPPGPQPAPQRAGVAANQLTARTNDANNDSASLRIVRTPDNRRG